MCKVLIIDDDREAASAIRDMLAATPVAERLDVSMAETFHAGDERPDIAIVDVQLADGASGIDLVGEMFPEGCRTQVIYATGYIEYCTAVYRTDHVSFLVKPIRQADLEAAVERALVKVEREKNNTISVAFGRTSQMLDVPSIEFIESNLRKISVHTSDGVFTTYESLDSIAKRLPATFVRCHKSFLVNVCRVRAVQTRELLMRSGASVPVSRSHCDAVRARIAEIRGLPLGADGASVRSCGSFDDEAAHAPGEAPNTAFGEAACAAGVEV